MTPSSLITPRQVLPDDHPIMATGGWMKYNLVATKRHEEEALAAVPSNFMLGTYSNRYIDI